MVERPTLVLLHGGPGFDHTIWADTMGPLSEWAQVVVYDHRGNGRSDAGPREKWTLEQWGDDVASFCDALDIEKPVVVGSSFGGFVAMSYAGRHPDHPSKLVLDSTSARLVIERMFPVFERLGGPAAVEAARRFWSDPSSENLLEYGQICMPAVQPSTRRDGEAGEQHRSHADEHRRVEALHRAGATHLRPDGALAKITCPTLVLSGDDDPVTPTACSEEIVVAASTRAIVRFERYAGGHGMFGELPEKAIRAATGVRRLLRPRPRRRDVAERCVDAVEPVGLEVRVDERRWVNRSSSSTSASRSRSVTSSTSVDVPGSHLVAEPRTHSSGTPRSTSLAAAAPPAAPIAPPASQPDGATEQQAEQARPHRPGDRACVRVTDRSSRARGSLPSSLLDDEHGVLEVHPTVEASRCAAVRNSCARNVSPNEMPTRVCGESSATTRC